MFTRSNHRPQTFCPRDFEDIARTAEKFGVTVTLDPMGLRLSKTKHTLRGTLSNNKIIPWTVFDQRCPPAFTIRADIQRLSAEIDAAATTSEPD